MSIIDEEVSMGTEKAEEERQRNRKLSEIGRYDLIKRVGSVERPPAHYDVGIPPVKYITSHGLGFLEGNIIKYVTRYKMKGDPVEDLHKARVYIDLLLKGYEV